MTSKTHIDFFFEDTVIDFYRYSNEVEEFYTIFKNQIFPNFSDKHINWLEVGIGNGEKILKTLTLFDKKPKITFLEPSNRWINELIISGNFDKLKNGSDINGTHRTFEDFTSNSNGFSFNLISFIQVLYEPHLVKSLFQFIDNKKNEKPYTLIINLENEENDFYKIRKQIAENNIDVPISQLSNIEKALKKRNIKYLKYNSENKILNVSVEEIIQSDNHWFYPFVFGCAKNEFIDLEEVKKNKLKKIINSNLLKINKLNIKDTTIVTLL